MLQHPRVLWQNHKHRVKLCSRPVLGASLLAFFVVWIALIVNTLDAWQQRLVLIEKRRLHAYAQVQLEQPAAAAPLLNNTPTQPSTFVVAPPLPLAAPPTVHPKTGRFVAAWLPTSFDADAARASFAANTDVLDEISPFWYTTRADDGSLVPEKGGRDRSIVKAAQAANVLVLPTIHNVPDPNAILPVLENPELRKRHIAAIIAEMRAYEYDGIDIDYEMLPASSREAYSRFMTELAAALQTEGKLFSVAVHAKTHDGGGLGSFQDWALLGEICDRVRIMTYDYHWRGSAPGPVAPLNWVRDVASYARTVIPPEKVHIGVPFYAYDWGAEQPAAARTWNDVQDLIERHAPEVNFAASGKGGAIEESWFLYDEQGATRTVWFADHRSLMARLVLVEELDIGGIAIWRLGSEDPYNWNVIRQQRDTHPAILQRTINNSIPDH